MDDLSELYEDVQKAAVKSSSRGSVEGTLENTLYDGDDQVSEHPVAEQDDYYQQLADQARDEQEDPEQVYREKAWGDTLSNEYGGAYESNIGSAQAMIQDMDQTGELKTALNETRAGSHPGMVKFLVRMARQLGY